MAWLTVTEFKHPFTTRSSGMPMVRGAKTAQNNVAIAGASAQSAAFHADTGVIRVETDVICCIEIGGTNPTAVVVGASGSSRMVAGQTEYFYVRAGDKIAVIAST